MLLPPQSVKVFDLLVFYAVFPLVFRSLYWWG